MAKRTKISCDMVARIPGDTSGRCSDLHRGLLKLCKNNRPLANYIYASYLQDGVADVLDTFFGRNSQGQHSAKDVFDFFDGKKIMTELSSNNNIKDVETLNGFRDSTTGDRVAFTDAEEAFKKADEFNYNNKARTAFVVANGDVFNIILINRDSQSAARKESVSRAIALWDSFKNYLVGKGITEAEVKSLNPSIFYPSNIVDAVKYLQLLKFTNADAMTEADIKTILTLNKGVSKIDNLVSRFGGIDSAASRMYAELRDPAVSDTVKTQIREALLVGRTFSNIDIAELTNEISTESANFELTNDDFSISETLNELNSKYKIEANVIQVEMSKLNSFSQVIGAAVLSLKRQIRAIESEKGTTPTTDEMRDTQNTLMKELESKKYISGVYEYFTKALNYINRIDPELHKVQTGTMLERISNIAKVVSTAQNMFNSYYDIAKTISNLDDITMDIDITQSDKEAIISMANEIRDILDKQSGKLKELRETLLRNLTIEFIGDSPYNCVSVDDIVGMVKVESADGKGSINADSSMFDMLYSVSRQSSPIIAMAGAIIEEAQTRRTQAVSEVARDLRRATNDLYKAGHNSSFVIKKGVDMIAYNRARDKFLKGLEKKGITDPIEVRKAFAAWEKEQLGPDGKISKELYRGTTAYLDSEYDFDAFNQARAKFIGKLKGRGIEAGTPEFYDELERWEEDNTEEYTRDGIRVERVPKLSRYRNDEFQKGWDQAQKDYYEAIMDIKWKIGNALPQFAQNQFLAPQKRKSFDQIIKAVAQKEISFRSAVKIIGRNLNAFRLKEDDTNFSENGIIDGSASIATNYDGSVLKNIPIFYVNKLEDPNNISQDVSGSLQALACSAFNYKEMTEIRDILNAISDYSREVSPTESRNKRGETYSKARVFVQSLARMKQTSSVSNMLDGFIDKHLYGIERKYDRESEVQKAAHVFLSNLIGYTSIKGLALNLKGAISNRTVGIVQNMIEAGAGQYFNFADLMLSAAVLLGTNTVGNLTPDGKLVELLTNNYRSKETLLADLFDPEQDNYQDYTSARYHKSVFGKIYGSLNPMHMYKGGEYWIHTMNMFAVLFHEKVVYKNPLTGERSLISLYEAFEKEDDGSGNNKLSVKDGCVKIDGTKIDTEYLNEIRRRIKHVNQNCHGSMNKEDKGLIHQYALGQMTMQFRQWMVEHYSRRYRGLHWDATIRDVNLSNFYTKTKVLLNGKKVKLIDAIDMVDTGAGDGTFTPIIKNNVTFLDGTEVSDVTLNDKLEKYAADSGWRRGYWIAPFKLIAQCIREKRQFDTNVKTFWNEMSETEKADCRRVGTEMLMMMSLLGISLAMGDPDRHRGEFMYRLFMYNTRRVLFDELGSVPFGIPFTLKTMINDPIASSQTIVGLLYPLYGYLFDAGKTVKTGRYAGWNKYAANVLKYSVPFWNQIMQMVDFADNDTLFKTFDHQLTR